MEEVRSRLTSGKAESKHEYLQQPPEAFSQKRKRPREAEALPESDPASDRRKRARIPLSAPSLEDNPKPSEEGASDKEEDPVAYWTQYGRWPDGDWDRGGNMSHLLARKKSETSLARKSSNAGSTGSSNRTPSDDKPRELKSAPYKHPGYKVLLGTLGSFMEESDRGITVQSMQDYHELLNSETEVPKDSLFRDDIFKKACRNVQDRNEAKIIQDITRLLVPSAESLTTYGATTLQRLTESVNEGWNNSIPLTKTRPQPDYAVGFRREAFTADQLRKLEPFIGGLFDVSYFMATYYMYLPFLTCEVKCGAAALDIADRQNAHSMTLAVRAIVELFRYVGREKEIDREILAYSISHDHCAVRIYGHYPVIEGKGQKYYRHPIHKFDFTALDGKYKWTTYKFTKNVYELWMPKHFERLSKVIEQLPADVNFDLSQQSELNFTERSGLTQDLRASHLAQSFASSQSSQELVDHQSSVEDAQNVTPNTSVNDGASPKKPRRKRGRRATRTPSPKT